MILVDLTHTSHCRANTGIQRVSRRLFQELAALVEVEPICYDPFGRRWRPLNREELTGLSPPLDRVPSGKRGSRWSLRQRLRGHLSRWRTADTLSGATYRGLIVPEVFSETVGQAYPLLKPLVDGPRLAIAYDLLAVNHQRWAPSENIARFPTYLEQLRQFDRIAAISEQTRDELGAYWADRGAHPPISTVSLGADFCRPTQVPPPETSSPPRILSVGTLEARKNHLTLLEAAERLWSRGRVFTLVLVGSLNVETGTPAHQRILMMQQAGRPIRWLGAISETRLREEYLRAKFTVFPSHAEGYGLPVVESLAMGRPCVCSDRGVVAELAQDGGCERVAVDSIEALAEGMDCLLSDPERLAKRRAEAAARTFKTWRGYAGELLELLQEAGAKSFACPNNDPKMKNS